MKKKESNTRGALDLRSAVALVEAAVRSAGKCSASRRTAAAMVGSVTTVVVNSLTAPNAVPRPAQKDAQPTVSLAKAARRRRRRERLRERKRNAAGGDVVMVGEEVHRIASGGIELVASTVNGPRGETLVHGGHREAICCARTDTTTYQAKRAGDGTSQSAAAADSVVGVTSVPMEEDSKEQTRAEPEGESPGSSQLAASAGVARSRQDERLTQTVAAGHCQDVEMDGAEWETKSAWEVVAEYWRLVDVAGADQAALFFSKARPGSDGCPDTRPSWLSRRPGDSKGGQGKGKKGKAVKMKDSRR